MSVTNYTSKTELCKYSYDRLKNVIYLVSKSHVKDVHIDNGEAYIEDLSEAPLAIRGFNIAFSEESSLDERYKFTKRLTISLKGYVSPSTFSGRYYVIIQSEDGTYWMINTDFPVKVTYNFNLNAEQYQTDFTFSLQSNFPTLRLMTGIGTPSDLDCGYGIPGIKSLRLLEKDYCAINKENATVYTYGKSFQLVEFLGDSCSLTESFDGENVTTTIDFNISFDKYKSSWHYNLLEFLQNLYSGIIVPKKGDNAFYAGFNFGLQPSFTISTDKNSPDIITVTLVEMSNAGLVVGAYSESEDTDTSWSYVSRVGSLDTYECVGNGIAKYLVQQEINSGGIATGRYKALQGYSFPSLNIIGYFSDVVTFPNQDCYHESCSLYTDMPDTVTFTSVACGQYTITSTCPWSISNIPSYITISPANGDADVTYLVSVCNTQAITNTTTDVISILYGSNVLNKTIVRTSQTSILTPTSHTINCLEQTVTFNFDPNCPITVTSISDNLSYTIGTNTLTVTVPKNPSDNSISWAITVSDCHGGVQTVYVNQDKTYSKWVVKDGYICVEGSSYKKEEKYTGTTSTDINTPTGEYRPGDLIQSGDDRCKSSITRWMWLNHYYCFDGDKYKALEEQISYDNGTTWTETGVTKLGDLVEADSSWCDLPVTYSWRVSTKWECGE